MLPPLRSLLIAAIFAVALGAQTQADATCVSCHQEGEKVAAGVHAKVGCTNCHLKHEEYPHPEKASNPPKTCATCHGQEGTALEHSVHGQAAKAGKGAPGCADCHGAAHTIQPAASFAFRKEVPDLCGMCHDQVAAEFKGSTHGQKLAQGSVKAPVCTSCHGEHAIAGPHAKNSSVNAVRLADTCAQCHGKLALDTEFRSELNRISTFNNSFHGLSLKSGLATVANCASCHGVHNILSASDPKSMIHRDNVAATCGKCHSGAGERFKIESVHFSEERAEPPMVALIRQFYIFLIPGVIGLMVLHNGGDWIRKLSAMRFRGAPVIPNIDVDGTMIRMHRFERYQHAALAISFLVLTWSGFALIYPDAWWSKPLLVWEDKWPVRGIIHRAASVVFIVVTVIHAISLFYSRRLRNHWLDLMPRGRDFTQAIGMFAYNLGLKKERPQLSEHSYIEKAEYWAVVWGAIIMIGTGLLLWLNKWALAYLPKSILDVAAAVHFYEAVLAALSILVWHFYFVLIDPDVYPMDTAWLTGKGTRLRTRTEEHNGDKEPATESH